MEVDTANGKLGYKRYAIVLVAPERFCIDKVLFGIVILIIIIQEFCSEELSEQNVFIDKGVAPLIETPILQNDKLCQQN